MLMLSNNRGEGPNIIADSGQGISASQIVIITARQRSCKKVMLSAVSVILLGVGISPCTGPPPPLPPLYRVSAQPSSVDMPPPPTWHVQIGPHCTGPQLPFLDMFNLDLTVHTQTFKLVHYEARTVGKGAVGIRLKCLLVIYLHL